MSISKNPFRPRLLFIVTEDWYFCSHRLPLAKAAIEAGFDVSVASRVSEYSHSIRAHGIRIHEWKMSRGSTGLVEEFRALYRLWKIYRVAKPDIVHQVALKPVLYGTFVAKLCGTRAVVNALGGMGSIFTAGSRRKHVLKMAILSLFRFLLSAKGRILILQNPDDRELMVTQAHLDESRIRLIRGAGVDLCEFAVMPEPGGVPLVVLPARMLWDKGIGEFVEAARLLRIKGVVARFVLAGGIDECNPSGIPQSQLEQWQAEGVVEWLGLCRDMPNVLQNANIVCLPSYREGLPKALLEAAACARAIVSTDVPGCREIVRDRENGLLVPVRDSIALAAALDCLISSPALRAAMGQRGREMVVAEFSEQIVVKQTIDIYSDLLEFTSPSAPLSAPHSANVKPPFPISHE